MMIVDVMNSGSQLKCTQFHASSLAMSCLCHGLCICLCLFLCRRLSNCIFVGKVMSIHPSGFMSQRSQVSRIALWMCSLNVFLFVIVFVVVFVIVFFWSGHVSSSLWSYVSKVTSVWYTALWICSLNIFVFVIVFCLCIDFSHCLFLVRSCLFITLIICLNSHKSLGSLFECVL